MYFQNIYFHPIPETAVFRTLPQVLKTRKSEDLTGFQKLSGLHFIQNLLTA